MLAENRIELSGSLARMNTQIQTYAWMACREVSEAVGVHDISFDRRRYNPLAWRRRANNAVVGGVCILDHVGSFSYGGPWLAHLQSSVWSVRYVQQASFRRSRKCEGSGDNPEACDGNDGGKVCEIKWTGRVFTTHPGRVFGFDFQVQPGSSKVTFDVLALSACDRDAPTKVKHTKSNECSGCAYSAIQK